MSSCLLWPHVGWGGWGRRQGQTCPRRGGQTGPRGETGQEKHAVGSQERKRQAAAWQVGRGCGFRSRGQRGPWAGPARELSTRAGAQACGDKRTEGFLRGRLTEALAPATASRDLQHKKTERERVFRGRPGAGTGIWSAPPRRGTALERGVLPWGTSEIRNFHGLWSPQGPAFPSGGREVHAADPRPSTPDPSFWVR